MLLSELDLENQVETLSGTENLEISDKPQFEPELSLNSSNIFSLQSVDMQVIQIWTMQSTVEWLYRWVHLILMFLMILYGQAMTKY